MRGLDSLKEWLEENDYPERGLRRLAGAMLINAIEDLTRFSHHLPVEARDRPVITSLRLPAVLTVLSKYTSARQAARASY